MDTYCAAAFTQIYADNASRYRLCCHANVNPDIIKYNTNNCNPFEYFLSDEMEQIRDDMLSGKKIAGCATMAPDAQKWGRMRINVPGMRKNAPRMRMGPLGGGA